MGMQVPSKQVGRQVFNKNVYTLSTYVLLNSLYVQLLGSIYTLCNYNVTTLIVCETKCIYDVIKNTKKS